MVKKNKKHNTQNNTIYILNNNEIQPINVQLGITDNHNTKVISDDLNAGDRVVTGENSNGSKPPSSVGMRMF